MPRRLPSSSGELSAADFGRICGRAAHSQRSLGAIVEDYPDLFPSKPFDPTFFSTLSMNCAFCAPSLSGTQLDTLHRAYLWVFATDWLIDYAATSESAVLDVVRSCRDVLDGREPRADDPLSHLLARLRDDVRAGPAFRTLGATWRDHVRRMLTAMRREWRWRRAIDDDRARRPSLAEYLANADSAGFGVAFASFWMLSGEVPPVRRRASVTAAARAAQRVLRLQNDLASYERDTSWGDVNSMLLGVSREQVEAEVASHLHSCRVMFDDLRLAVPKVVLYLERQLGFNTGLYRFADYWGTL